MVTKNTSKEVFGWNFITKEMEINICGERLPLGVKFLSEKENQFHLAHTEYIANVFVVFLGSSCIFGKKISFRRKY